MLFCTQWQLLPRDAPDARLHHPKGASFVGTHCFRHIATVCQPFPPQSHRQGCRTHSHRKAHQQHSAMPHSMAGHAYHNTKRLCVGRCHGNRCMQAGGECARGVNCHTAPLANRRRCRCTNSTHRHSLTATLVQQQAADTASTQCTLAHRAQSCPTPYSPTPLRFCDQRSGLSSSKLNHGVHTQEFTH